MSHLPGQPHHSFGLSEVGRLTPHEAVVTGHSGRPHNPPKKTKKNTSSTMGDTALIPDSDPWRPRKRRFGLDDDDDFSFQW